MQERVHLGDSLLQGTANRRGVTKLRKQLRNCSRHSVGGWLLRSEAQHMQQREEIAAMLLPPHKPRN